MTDTELVKEKLNMVDVVSPYVKLTRAGKYWKGTCPFHKEKTPSFMVSPERGFYHCFGCGKGGDIFTFIEEIEGLDFKGALTLLAEKAGVRLTHEHASVDTKARERVYSALEAARVFFVSTLDKNPRATAYLTERGITPESRALWSLGYAPEGWHVLLEALRDQGFTDLEIEHAGLAKRPDAEEGKDVSRLYDRFRGRIMFPRRARERRTIAFPGRIFPNADDVAKYLNSPETSVFTKSKVLYGLDLARSAIRKYNFVILVEGQVDLIMAHQSGYQNAVATSGTAFTEEHAALLMRTTPNIVIAYDGDRAGVAATGRAALIALKAGMNVKVAAMPPGEDPADVIRRDVGIWKAAVKRATHIVDFYLEYLANSGYNSRDLKLEVSRTVLPYVAMIGNAIDRAHFVSRVAAALGVPESAVSAEVTKVGHIPTKAALAGLAPSAIQSFMSRGETIERLLAGVAKALDETGDTTHASAIRTALGQIPEVDRAALIEADLYLERCGTPEEVDAAIIGLLEELKKEAAHDQYRAAVLKLKSAEEAKDTALSEAMMRELAVLAQNLN